MFVLFVMYFIKFYSQACMYLTWLKDRFLNTNNKVKAEAEESAVLHLGDGG